jgi:hypothetical protein
VHDASVIPDDEIHRVFPFDGTYIFGLGCVFVQVFEQWFRCGALAYIALNAVPWSVQCGMHIQFRWRYGST